RRQGRRRRRSGRGSWRTAGRRARRRGHGAAGCRGPAGSDAPAPAMPPARVRVGRCPPGRPCPGSPAAAPAHRPAAGRPRASAAAPRWPPPRSARTRASRRTRTGSRLRPRPRPRGSPPRCSRAAARWAPRWTPRRRRGGRRGSGRDPLATTPAAGVESWQKRERDPSSGRQIPADAYAVRPADAPPVARPAPGAVAIMAARFQPPCHAMTEPLSARRAGPVVHLVLDRPALHNAFDAALIDRLTGALEEVAADDAVRVVVLSGAGASFSAGADLNWMRGMAAAGEAENRADALALARLMRTLDELPRPTIARVHGAAFGGGVGLVACCDIAI